MRSRRDPSRRLVAAVLRRRRRAALVGCLASVVHQTCEALVPVAIGLVVDGAVRRGDGTAMALSVAGLVVLFALLTSAGTFAFWTIDRGVFAETHDLRVRVVRTAVASPAAAGRRSGDLLSVATLDVRHAAEVVGLLSWLVAATLGTVVSAVVLLRVDAPLGLGLLVVVPLLVVGLQLLAPRLERRVGDRQRASGLAAATAADLLAGLRPLRGFGGVGAALARYRGVSRTSRSAAVGAAGASAVLVGVSTLATGALLVATAAVAGSFVLSGRITLGEFVTVVGMASFLSDPVRTITTCVQQLAVSRASAGRVAEVLAHESGVVPRGGRAAGPVVVALEDLAVAGLEGVSVTTRPGELLGVVTTRVAAADALTALLAGERDPDAGSVRVGAPPGADPREHVLVEPHAVRLLGTTVADALDTGAGPGPVAVADALAAASARDVVGAVPGGLDGALQDAGTNLSGGQRQRLALARALVADRPVLVLRDPTTAVDAVTEDLVAEGLRALRAGGDRTTVLVTTSPALLGRCDRVLFAPVGAPARTGAHAALLADPDYAGAVLR